MFKMPILETKRLIVKEILLKDYRDMNEYAKNPEIGPMAGWEPHTSLRYTRQVIKLQRERLYRDMPCVFAIHLKDTGKMIGTTEVYSINNRTMDVAELGYTISDKYRNQGFATEAASALVKWVFEVGLCDKLICTTFPENKGSQKVIEKLGFTYIKYLEQRYTRYDGTIHDLLYYELNKDDYKKEGNN